MEPEIDTAFQGQIVCPYCGHRHEDSWEMAGNDEEDVECDCYACDKTFRVTTHISIKYSSHQLPIV